MAQNAHKRRFEARCMFSDCRHSFSKSLRRYEGHASLPRPVAGTRLLCISIAMKLVLLLTLTIFLCTGTKSSALEEIVEQQRKPHPVRGFLNAHWEYPRFLFYEDSKHKSMPFQFKGKKWSDIYWKGFEYDYKYRPSKIRCFQVSGEGYITPVEHFNVYDNAHYEFIFTKVTKMKVAHAAGNCE